jgi:hypothetical protein
MKNLGIGCLFAVAGGVLVCGAAVVAVGLILFGFSKSHLVPGPDPVIISHFYPVPTATALPRGATSVLLTGTHPIKVAADGHSAADSVSGLFFVNQDSGQLTLVEEAPEGGPPRRVASVVHDFAFDLEIYDDGAVRTVPLPEARSKALLDVRARRSPDGSRYAWVDEKRSALVVSSKPDGTGERVLASGLAPGERDVLWSFDGRRVFVYVYDDQLYHPDKPPVKNAVYAVDVDAPKLRKVWEEPEATKYCYTFTHVPGRDALLFLHDNRVEALDCATGETSVFWQPPAGVDAGLHFPKVSPDGTKVAVMQGYFLYVLDTSSGRELAKIAADDVPDRRQFGDVWFAPDGRILYLATGYGDHVGGTNWREMNAWGVTNTYLYAVNADGTGRRQLSNRAIGLDVVTVVAR